MGGRSSSQKEAERQDELRATCRIAIIADHLNMEGLATSLTLCKIAMHRVGQARRSVLAAKEDTIIIVAPKLHGNSCLSPRRTSSQDLGQMETKRLILW